MILCTSCNDRRPARDRIRCQRCIDLSTVRAHQLAKRRGWVARYRKHTCGLCRKYSGFVMRLIQRWDERKIWILRECPKGHLWVNSRSSQSCTECEYLVMMGKARRTAK